MARNKIRCNLCGGKKYQKFLKKKQSSLVKCQICGLIFVNPQPSQKELNKLYQKQYFKSTPSQQNIETYGDYFADKPVYTRYFIKKLNQIKKFKNKGKIL